MPYDLSRLDLLLVEADPGMQATWRSLCGGLGIRRPVCVPGIAQAGTRTFEWGPVTASRKNPTYFVRN